MTNITLIGGSGFVGTRLIELLKDEYQIGISTNEKVIFIMT